MRKNVNEKAKWRLFRVYKKHRDQADPDQLSEKAGG